MTALPNKHRSGHCMATEEDDKPELPVKEIWRKKCGQQVWGTAGERLGENWWRQAITRDTHSWFGSTCWQRSYSCMWWWQQQVQARQGECWRQHVSQESWRETSWSYRHRPGPSWTSSVTKQQHAINNTRQCTLTYNESQTDRQLLSQSIQMSHSCWLVVIHF